MKVLDRLAASTVNYWAGFALDVVVSIATLAAGFAAGAAATGLAAAAAGVVVYTFYEYALHRWVYHALPTPVRAIHARHHREPTAMVGAPFFYTLVVTGANWLVAGAIAGWAAGAIFAGAILLLYAYQSAIHHIAHGWPGTRGRWLTAEFRRRHLAHHKDGRANFGILFTVWDRLLGTYRAKTPRRC